MIQLNKMSTELNKNEGTNALHTLPRVDGLTVGIVCAEWNDQITQSFAVAQLTEHHRKQLVPATETLYVSVSVVLSYDTIELTAVKKIG